MDTKKVAITLMVITISLMAVSFAADLGNSGTQTQQSQGNTQSNSQGEVSLTVEAPDDNSTSNQNNGGTQ